MFFDDEEDDLLGDDPTEDQLEALLLEEEGDLSSDLDEGPSAFAAAEEYAKLLEDDVDEKTIEEFRAKRKKKKGTKKPSDSQKSNLGKRKSSGFKKNDRNPKRSKRF